MIFLTSSLARIVVSIQYVMHIPQNVCLSTAHIIGTVYVAGFAQFGGVSTHAWTLDCVGVGALTPLVPGSAVPVSISPAGLSGAAGSLRPERTEQPRPPLQSQGDGCPQGGARPGPLRVGGLAPAYPIHTLYHPHRRTHDTALKVSTYCASLLETGPLLDPPLRSSAQHGVRTGCSGLKTGICRVSGQMRIPGEREEGDRFYWGASSVKAGPSSARCCVFSS